MKKSIIALSILAFVAAGQTAFGAGPGGPQYQALQQPATQNICTGSPETITGVVTGTWVPGVGLTIEGDNGPSTVFGLGPVWYWDANGVDRPEIGEIVTVVASEVIYAGKKVILSITTGDATLQLRDPATCQPIWRGHRIRPGAACLQP